ncbi:MAG TPA: 4-hydroxy-3-methylbut-2-enyl diphosphate reductase [Pirellulales bacterium]|nr:4-hydroxy-3-methylbut-2-enyl diphosphate reductase [Pirellulales bacterium]
MKILRAEALGFCFGVRDALALAEAVRRPDEVAIHGELVHNESVLAQLQSRGFRQTEETARQLDPRPIVMIAAHGVSDSERARLTAAGKRLIDSTCPLVHRAHRAAKSLAAEGRHVLVLGKPGHVEVQGIVEDLTACDVVPGVDEVRTYGCERLGVVCQTTTPPRLAERILSAIRERNPQADIRVVDTICQPTRDRQQAVLDLLGRVDAMVVVGGRHSNNTRELVALCQEHHQPVCHVQSAADLDPAWFRGKQLIGLTAGTSTPDAVIDEAERALADLLQEESP